MQGKLTSKQAVELRLLSERHKVLLPAAVVAFAKSPKAALHTRFTWDDTQAAKERRIDQARYVMRMLFITSSAVPSVTRALVSLTQDRKRDGGYRPVLDVMNDAQLTAMMLEDALAELNTFRRKYQGLTALAKVFEAVDAVEKKTKRRTKKAA